MSDGLRAPEARFFTSVSEAGQRPVEEHPGLHRDLCAGLQALGQLGQRVSELRRALGFPWGSAYWVSDGTA